MKAFIKRPLNFWGICFKIHIDSENMNCLVARSHLFVLQFSKNFNCSHFLRLLRYLCLLVIHLDYKYRELMVSLAALLFETETKTNISQTKCLRESDNAAYSMRMITIYILLLDNRYFHVK